MQEIATTPLFSSLAESQLETIQKVVKLKALKKDEIVFSEGEPALGLFIVHSGLIKVFRIGIDGREVVLHLIRPGQVFAEVSALQGGFYPSSAQAVEKTEVLILSRADLVKVISSDPNIALGMLANLSQRLKELVDKVEGLTIQDVPQRLATYLLHRALDVGTSQTEFELDVSRSLLAGVLGSARETVSRCLSRLEESGIIEMNGRTVTIIDSSYLKRLSDGIEKL